MENNEITDFLKDLLKAERICLIGHQAPDGDCIMSMMAFYEYLRLIGKSKNTFLYLNGEIPYNYHDFIDQRFFNHRELNLPYDLVVAFDCANKERLGGREIFDSAQKTYSIDHHASNTLFADVNFVDPYGVSTGEIIFSMLKGAKQTINKRMAECLYITILTDTEKFMKKKTTAKTHQITAELMLIGIDTFDINQKVYRSKPHGVALVQAACMVGIQLFYEGRLGIVKVTQEIAKLNGGKVDEIDGLIDWLCEIKNVEVGCVLRECDKHLTRISLRTKNSRDILSIARKYKGGGHWDTVGFVLKKNIFDAQTLIINEFASIFSEIRN